MRVGVKTQILDRSIIVGKLVGYGSRCTLPEKPLQTEILKESNNEAEKALMRILVTGGCGFIGSHLVDFLVNRGDEVVVLDDLSVGKLENVPASVRVVKGDVIDAKLVAETMRGVDACVHLAAIVSVPLCREVWYRAHCVNQSGLVNILDNARKEMERTGVRLPVVYASSAAVYGGEVPMPASETARVAPISSYGVDKNGCEIQARVASVAYGVPTVGLRFFNVYGPRQVLGSPYSGVISAFLQKGMSKQPLMIHGDGLQERDFIHVSDVVQALAAALERVGNEPLVANVCTGKGITIKALAEKVMALCGYDAPLQFGEPRKDDIRRSIGDPLLAKQSLGFTAQKLFDEGLQETLAYCMEERAS
jgi:UDP-glucose 4-epimerase